MPDVVEDWEKEEDEGMNNFFKYILPRVLKQKPKKVKTLASSIKSMCLHKGKINDTDVKLAITKLENDGYIKIDSRHKISYLVRI